MSYITLIISRFNNIKIRKNYNINLRHLYKVICTLHYLVFINT